MHLSSSKMACSPQEIEKKRQEALKRLARHNSSPSPIKSNAIKVNETVSPRTFLNFKRHMNSTSDSGTKTGSWSRRKPYETAKTSNFAVVQPTATKIIRVTIKLVSASKFLVEMSSFSGPVVEVLKTIPSKNFNPNTREWSFSLSDYENVTTKLGNLKTQNVVIEPLPQFLLRCLKDASLDTEIELSESQIESALYQTLLPFQLEGIQFGVKRKGRCLIADDMGLGKTFQALGIVSYFRRDWPLLIVTTASMKNVWEETIHKYLPSVSVLQVQYMVSAKDYIGSSEILIVSHDLMSRCNEKLLERGFGSIIIDESHNLKNHKTKATQAALKLCKQAKRVVLLSGTPAMSRPKELYSQLEMIESKFFASFFEYAKRYCDMQQTPFGLNTSGQSNLQELEILLKRKFMIRRKKEDVLGSLPSKSHEVVKLDLDLNRLDEEDKKRMAALSSQMVTAKSRDKHALLLTFFSETARTKIPAVCAYVENVLASKNKFLIFAHHLQMLDAIEQVLKFNNCKFVRIDGSTTAEQRKYFIDQFQSDDSYLCALLSITTANAGITLTAAQRVVFAELHWNPSILDQAEARVHRIGQNKAIQIQYLLADGTVDDFIWPLLQKKQAILQEMGLTKESLASVPQTSEYVPKQNTILNYVSSNSGLDSVERDDAAAPAEDDFMDDGFDDILCNVEI